MKPVPKVLKRVAQFRMRLTKAQAHDFLKELFEDHIAPLDYITAALNLGEDVSQAQREELVARETVKNHSPDELKNLRETIMNLEVQKIFLFSEQLSTAVADPGMSTALRSVGLPDVLSRTPAEPSVARLVSMPVCAASIRNPVRHAGSKLQVAMGETGNYGGILVNREDVVSALHNQ